MKLHVGALATLGVIVELNLRVQPQPEHRLLLLGRFPDAASACGFASAVRLDRGPRAGRARSSSAISDPISSLPENGLAIAVLFEGSESAVEAQLEAAQAHLRESPARVGRGVRPRRAHTGCSIISRRRACST
jgi:FAD/FMN-containing dehydrogenase